MLSRGFRATHLQAALQQKTAACLLCNTATCHAVQLFLPPQSFCKKFRATCPCMGGTAWRTQAKGQLVPGPEGHCQQRCHTECLFVPGKKSSKYLCSSLHLPLRSRHAF